MDEKIDGVGRSWIFQKVARVQLETNTSA